MLGCGFWLRVKTFRQAINLAGIEHTVGFLETENSDLGVAIIAVVCLLIRSCVNGRVNVSQRAVQNVAT